MASLDGSTVKNSDAELYLDSSGDLFGTAEGGGTNNGGGVFELAAGSQTLTTLVSLSGSNGSNPAAGLTADSAGNLYGTTIVGGADGDGTVFEIAAGTGAFTTLVSFDGDDGGRPFSSVIADAAGNLYGTTSVGGTHNDGTVFEIAAGTQAVTTLVNFIGSNGSDPVKSLIADASGNLYGTTLEGGAAGAGTVFEIASGTTKLSTLASFDGSNGVNPDTSLVADAAGNLFGTAAYGGASGSGTVFELAAGTHTLTTLASFDGSDGAYPYAGLLIDTVGDLFGTTEAGGAGGGTVFEIAAGTKTIDVLASFNGADGAQPWDSLITDGKGNLYGTTVSGGAYGDGTIFEVSLACYAAGTLIRTVRGEVPVEALAIGEVVVTASGAHRAIRWLGHRTVDCHNHSRPEETHPVRITRHAFGQNKPIRDLYISPDHSICIDVLGEVLIPASCLINGSTVVQVAVDRITYWHVELDSHDILIANGLASESYLDMGNRDFFVENAIVGIHQSPDADIASRTHADYCRPFVMGGPITDAVRLQLRRQAETLGWMLDDSRPWGDLHLIVDGTRIDPVVRGLIARFVVPAGAGDVWLVSATSRPSDVEGVDDTRHLGVSLAGLSIDDGFEERRVIALDDPLLCTGFHRFEGSWRWTTGRACLPAALWNMCADEFFLRVELARVALPCWRMSAPQPVASSDLPARIPATL